MPHKSPATYYLLVFLALGWACQSRQPETPAPDGQQLAEQHCQSCHLLPRPQDLDRYTWQKFALPQMGLMLGWFLGPKGYEPIPPAVYQEEAYTGQVPEKPKVTEQEWQAIAAYYLKNAPAEAPPAPARPHGALAQFRPSSSPYSDVEPGVTLLYPQKGGWLYTDAADGLTRLVNKQLQEKWKAAVPNVPVDADPIKGGLLVTAIGSFFPSEDSTGQLLRLPVANGKPTGNPEVLVSNLRRPVASAVADFNGDGQEDWAVAEFGVTFGGLSCFLSGADGTRERKWLNRYAGNIGVEVADVDGDGDLDLLAMVAQALEGLYLYRNQGDGRFSEETVLRFPPTWGGTGFQLVDFDQDGLLDILATHGDNADFAEFPPHHRPYHGIRLFRNTGKTWEEAWFYPLPGAYKALAADHDGDGDLDIAAVAYFADYVLHPDEGFVWLKQVGPLQFESFTLPESQKGRWLTLAQGDWDSDGDVDLVLGSALAGIETAPFKVNMTWREHSTALLVLENIQK